MARGPFGGRRPGANPTVKLVIKEIPVPTNKNQKMFPDPVLRANDTEKAIIEDIASNTILDESEISVDRASSFMRGLGQTNTYTIHIDASGYSAESMAAILENIDEAGYVFSAQLD